MAIEEQRELQKGLRELTNELSSLNEKQKNVAEAVLDAAREGKSNAQLAGVASQALAGKVQEMVGKLPIIGGVLNFASALRKARKEATLRKRQEELLKKQLGLNDKQFAELKTAKKEEQLRKQETEALNNLSKELGISEDEQNELIQAQIRATESGDRLRDTINGRFISQDKIDAERNSILLKSLERTTLSNDVVAQNLIQIKEANQSAAEEVKKSQKSMVDAVTKPTKSEGSGDWGELIVDAMLETKEAIMSSVVDKGGPSASQQVEMRNEEMRSAERRHQELIGAIQNAMGGGDGAPKEESGFLGGLLKVMAAVGPMIGATIGAIGAGLAAVGAAAGPAMLGALVLGGAILVIGAGIAGAAALMGVALPVVADGLDRIQPSLKKLEELNGVKLAQAAEGIGALFFPLMGLGVGGLLAGLADAKHLGDLGVALQKYNDVDGENLAKVGEGLAPFGGGLFKFALGGAFADLINLIAGNDIKSTMSNLAEGLMAFEGLNGENLAGIGQGVSGLGGGFAKLTAGGVLDGIVKFFGGGSPLGDFATDLQAFQDKTQGIEIQRLIRLSSAVGILGDTVKKFSELEQGFFSAFGFKQLGADLEQFADYLDDGEIDTIERATKAMDKFKNILSKNSTAETGSNISPGRSVIDARRSRTMEMDETFSENQDMRTSPAPSVLNAPNNVQNISNNSQSISQPIPIIDQSASHRRLARNDF